MKKQSIQDEISNFLLDWDLDHMCKFLDIIQHVLDLYAVDEHDDWVVKECGDEDAKNVRLIRTVYLMSKLADFHSGRLCKLSVQYPKLWKRIEKHINTSEEND